MPNLREGGWMGPFVWFGDATDDGTVFAPPTGRSCEKMKSSSKNLYLFTILHVAAPHGAKFKKIILTLQARSTSTHFRGVVMSSNADFMEICLEPKEFAYRSFRAEQKMGMKPS